MNAAGVVVNTQLPADVGDFTEIAIIATIRNPSDLDEGFQMRAEVGHNKADLG